MSIEYPEDLKLRICHYKKVVLILFFRQEVAGVHGLPPSAFFTDIFNVFVIEKFLAHPNVEMLHDCGPRALGIISVRLLLVE